MAGWILEKLSPDEATRFIFRFGRSTSDERDRDMVAWRLKSVYGLEGVTRDRVAEAILKAPVPAPAVGRRP